MSFSFICLCFSCAFALSPLTPFTFHAKGSPVSLAGDANCEARGASSFKESAPGIALAVNKKQGHCWRGGGYNYRDFTIQPGLTGSYRAYQISAPKTKPKLFAASDNIKFPNFIMGYALAGAGSASRPGPGGARSRGGGPTASRTVLHATRRGVSSRRRQ